MHEKPLLLHSARSGVLVGEKYSARHYMRWGALLVGLFVVLVGAADITTKLSDAALGKEAGFAAFAPAAAIGLRPYQEQNNPALFATSTSTPKVLSIPSLGVHAQIEAVGQKADGSMATPKNFADVGWYSLGARPGGEGSAVFAGHVNNALTRAGVFANLSQIKKGDYVSVEDSAGKTLVYKVSDIQMLEPNAATSSIFRETGPAQLVLITCDGAWSSDARQFDKRLVVVATPAY